jgi:hydrogenase maturation protease
MTRVFTFGQAMAGDDAAGLRVGEVLRATAPSLDIVELGNVGARFTDHLALVDEAILVDACRGGEPGRWYMWPARRVIRQTNVETVAGTHGFGVREALQLATLLHMLPLRTRVYLISGEDFTQGHEMTPAVGRAVRGVASAISQHCRVMEGISYA